MTSLKRIAALLALMVAGCAQVKPNEFTTLEVAAGGMKTNVMNSDLDGDADGFDVANVRVETPGPLKNMILPILIPRTGTKPYNESITALPARAKMWETLRSPAQKLVIEIRQVEVDRYLKTKGDPYRGVPAIDALALKSVETKK